MELITLATFAGALVIKAGTPAPSIAELVSRVITNGWLGDRKFYHEIIFRHPAQPRSNSRIIRGRANRPLNQHREIFSSARLLAAGKPNTD